MAGRSVTQQFVGTVGVFSLLGPLAGTVAAWIALVVATLADGSGGGWSFLTNPTDIVAFAILSLVVGYVLGVIPAAVTGAICHLFARHIRPTAGWIAACSGVGAMCAFCGPLVTGNAEYAGMMFGIIGAVAAAVCAFALRHARWR